jgi:hypothetical protein
MPMARKIQSVRYRSRKDNFWEIASLMCGLQPKLQNGRTLPDNALKYNANINSVALYARCFIGLDEGSRAIMIWDV